MVKNFNLKIAFGNKTFYTLIVIMILLITAGVVIAWQSGNPAVMGHSLGELSASGCADGKVMKVSGGVWTCGDVSGMPSGTFCGFSATGSLVLCDGHDPKISCPVGYHSVYWISGGAIGGNWYTCFKD